MKMKATRRTYLVKLTTASIATAAISLSAAAAQAQTANQDSLSLGGQAEAANRTGQAVEAATGDTSVKAEATASGQDASGQDASGQDASGQDASARADAKADARLAAPGPGQPWYRDRSGRFYYQNKQGQKIYESQVYRNQRAANRTDGKKRTDKNRQDAGKRSNVRGEASARKPQPRLGIALRDADNGVRIQAVQSGSPADKAGLRAGDVIRSVAGQAVQRSQNLVDRIRNMNVGDQVPFTVLRNGNEQQIQATLGSQQRVRVARPLLDGPIGEIFDREEATMQREFESLRKRVDRLRNEFNQMRRQMTGAAPAGNSQDDAAATSSGASIDASASGESGSTGRTVKDAAKSVEKSLKNAADATTEAADAVNNATQSAGKAAKAVGGLLE
jgi:hypothetical protein